jgi:hypothetical protein
VIPYPSQPGSNHESSVRPYSQLPALPITPAQQKSIGIAAGIGPDIFSEESGAGSVTMTTGLY